MNPEAVIAGACERLIASPPCRLTTKNVIITVVNIPNSIITASTAKILDVVVLKIWLDKRVW
jgi:hypothetical protein